LGRVNEDALHSVLRVMRELARVSWRGEGPRVRAAGSHRPAPADQRTGGVGPDLHGRRSSLGSPVSVQQSGPTASEGAEKIEYQNGALKHFEEIQLLRRRIFGRRAEKLSDSLPFYRPEKQFARIGVDVSRQDMANWSVAVFQRLRPLRELLRGEIRQGPLVRIDETTVRLMGEPGRPRWLPGAGKPAGDRARRLLGARAEGVLRGNGGSSRVAWLKQAAARAGDLPGRGAVRLMVTNLLLRSQQNDAVGGPP
jgi:hypothetical protein